MTFYRKVWCIEWSDSYQNLHHGDFQKRIYKRKDVTFIKNKKEILKNETNIFIPINILNSSSFSNYALASYSILKLLTVTTYIDKHYITPAQIEFYLTNKIGKSRRFANYIKCGIDELIDNKVIFKIGEYKDGYILDCSYLWIQDNSIFVIVTYEEIKKVFEIENTNNFLLLKYFIFLMGTISSKIEVYIDGVQSKTRVVGTFTIEKLAELSGISKRSIIEYNKLLEECGLLYVYRQNDFIINKISQEIKTLPNVYGRPSDKKYIDAFAENQKQHKESFRYITKNTEKVNNNRRLAQMYNQLVKLSEKSQEVKYSNGEIQDVYNYVISENRKYESLYDKDGYEKYLDKIRDIDVFDKYDFIKEEE